MNTGHKIIAAAFWVFLLSGCTPKNKQEKAEALAEEEGETSSPETTVVPNDPMPVADYMKWVQDPANGLRKEKEMDGLDFTVQYKPHEYIACMEERGAQIADTLLQSKLSEMEGVQYYDLKIMLKEKEGELLKFNITSPDQYDKRVKYFSFGMQQDIQLVEGKDTLPCVMYHFERTYDVAPSCTVLLGFDMKPQDIGKQKTLLVYDRTFNKGLLKFTFKENKLRNLPKLETL